jgi:biotin carboxyl carrier protein
MKLLAEVSGKKQEIEFKQEGAKIFAVVEDRQYELEFSEVEPNLYLFKHQNHIYEVYVSSNGIAHIKNHQIEVKIFDPKQLRGASGSAIVDDAIVEIKTAMPGKVVRILAQKGDKIKRGDGIVVVEAMKMQNEMKSPKDGVVKDIRCSEGETVEAGKVLAIIE